MERQQQHDEWNTPKRHGQEDAAREEEMGRGDDLMAEGAKHKGTGKHEGGHQEGNYDKQSDRPTIHPGNA